MKDLGDRLNLVLDRFSSLQNRNPKVHPSTPRQSRAGAACPHTSRAPCSRRCFSVCCAEHVEEIQHTPDLFDSFYERCRVNRGMLNDLIHGKSDAVFSTSVLQFSTLQVKF